MKKQSCIVCGKPLKDGIMINGRRICCSCEIRITKAEAGNDFYEYYKECIRRRIAEPMLRGVDGRCQLYHL